MASSFIYLQPVTSSSGVIEFGSTTSTTTIGTSGFTTSPTATGGVTTGNDNLADMPGVAGITLNQPMNNANLTLDFAGASAGLTDVVVLGNGGDDIIDGSTAGSASITLGTGSSYIDIHTGTGSGFYAVTLGTHTVISGSDTIYASEIGTFAGAGVANTMITGVVTGDVLQFASAATSAANVTFAQQMAITAAPSVSAAVVMAFADTPAANGALSFQYGGNTYVIDQAGVAGSAQVAADSVIELAGLHTLTAGVVTGGNVVLAPPPDYSTVTEDLYAIYLNREGDTAGLQGFEAMLAAANAPTTLADLEALYGSNAAVTAVINSFGTSAEFTSLYAQELPTTSGTGTLSANAAYSFVDSIFESELGRAPLPAGLLFWGNAIASGSLTTADAVLAITAAAMSNTADAATINNKITGTDAFNASTQTLTLNGSVIYGSDTGTAGYATNPAPAIGGTTGVTVAASTDNAHINVNLAGAAAGYTDHITVGNGNDYITDGSVAGSVTVTVGTGSNYIDIHSGKAAGVYTVTLGTHTPSTGGDFIYTSEIGSYNGAAVANTTITGAVAGDILGFATAATTAANVTTTQQTAITSATSLSAAVALAFSDTAAINQALAFNYGGNTYVVKQSGGIGAAQEPNDTIIELVGLHTLTAGSVINGHVWIAS